MPIRCRNMKVLPTFLKDFSKWWGWNTDECKSRNEWEVKKMEAVRIDNSWEKFHNEAGKDRMIARGRSGVKKNLFSRCESLEHV